MSRLGLLLRNELRSVRSARAINVLAVLQPPGMFLLLGMVFFTPTLDMEVSEPTSEAGRELLAAMDEVRSPELAYIRPVLGAGVEPDRSQRVSVELRDGTPTAVHRFGMVDGNTVKNHRNRLTAALMRLWNGRLGGRSVQVNEHPWLPRDVPFMVYIGMAMLPLGAFLSAAFVGAFCTAQDFERGTILEYRLSPVPWPPVVAARLLRLVLTSATGVALMVVLEGAVTHHWPAVRSLPVVALTLLSVSFAGACVGMVAGLVVRATIPSFLVALIASLAGWIMGCAFGLPGIFGRTYDTVGLLSPNTHAVKLLFPAWYGVELPAGSMPGLVLGLQCLMLAAAVMLAWRRSVFARG